MDEKLTFVIVRIYQCSGRAVDFETRAIVQVSRQYECGQAVRFTVGSTTYFGDVISSMTVSKDGELHSFLKDFAERTVIVHLATENN